MGGYPGPHTDLHRCPLAMLWLSKPRAAWLGATPRATLDVGGSPGRAPAQEGLRFFSVQRKVPVCAAVVERGMDIQQPPECKRHPT